MTREKDWPANFLLQTLQRLMAIPGGQLENALSEACSIVAEALQSEKVDAFLYDESRDCLVAVGTSATPLSRLQKRLGLDVLQISNGGRVVQVYQSGEPFLTGRLQDDPEELRGVKCGLKIQSKIGIPLEIGGRRRGMIMIASLKADFFDQSDVEFAEFVTRWIAVVAHRAELIQEMTHNAVEQGRRQDAEELITVLAHDLRNYLSPLTARLEVIRVRAQRQDRQDDVGDVDLALKSVASLKQVVSDILDVARIDRGLFALDLEPVDLANCAEEISSMFSTASHQVLMEVAERTIVKADIRRLRQCLENLIANALQHSPNEAPVRLLVHTDRRQTKIWGIIEVQNEGPGIPPELMSSIFERFVAGPNSHGLGLGLYLAKRIAVAHGGDLSVVSRPGQGTRFVLHVPCYDDTGAKPS
jgi:two-component system, OmpR family, sensor kinase